MTRDTAKGIHLGMLSGCVYVLAGLAIKGADVTDFIVISAAIAINAAMYAYHGRRIVQ